VVGWASVDTFEAHEGSWGSGNTNTLKGQNGGDVDTRPVLAREWELAMAESVMSGREEGQGVLPTLIANLTNPETQQFASGRVLIDSGAQISLCTSLVRKFLALPVERTKVHIGAIGGGEPLLADEAVELEIRSQHGPARIKVRCVVLPELTGVNRSLAYHPYDKYPSAKHLGPLADAWPQPEGVVSVVVLGQDSLWAIMKGGKPFWPTEGDPWKGPVFIATPFGVIVQGYEENTDRRGTKWSTLVTSLKVPGSRKVTERELREPPLEELLRRMWSLESIGIKVPLETGLSASEQYAVEFLEQNMEFLKTLKKFRVRIPFSPTKPPLINNRYSAQGRLDTLMRHLERFPEKHDLYVKGMQKYLDKNHCTVITPEDEQAEEVFYLPHSGVLEPVPGGGGIKLRIVFDCSAKDRQGNSLNDTMVTGPVPDADLVRILTLWRKYPYAFNMDVKECFLNILLHPKDQNKFRFLWYPEGKKVGEPVTYKFTSLIFGSKCSPWISSTCLWKLLDLYEESHPQVVQRAKRGLWVDDVLLSTETLGEGIQMISQLEKIFATASFSLAKFTASHDDLLMNLKDEQVLFGPGEEKGPVKALGVEWDIPRDEIFVAGGLEDAFERTKPRDTKRTVARMVATVFDPLQLLLPWKVGGNLLIRQIWEHHEKDAEARGISKTAKCLWDEPLPLSIQENVDEWKKDYHLAQKVRIPRCLQKTGTITGKEIWGFCDASPLAFGAVVYLRTKYDTGPPEVRFVVARGKVNPPKGQTLPRCELLAAKFLATLSTSVREYLEIPEKEPMFLFGDSMIALHWIKQDPEKWKVFVANAVTMIQKCTRQEDWYHVAGTDNPADLLTRPQPLREVVGNEFWLNGPLFVKSGRIPDQPDWHIAPDEALGEIRKTAQEALVGVVARRPEDHCVKQIFDRYEDGLKALRILAAVKRGVDKFRKRSETRSQSIRSQLYATMDMVARYLQETSFSEERRLISKGEPLPKSNRLSALDPFIDDAGLLRMRGRGTLHSSALPFDWMYPVIIPADSEILAKIVLYVHESNNHAGTDFIHAHMRQRWWILRGRATIQRYKKRCSLCQRFDGPMMSQKMAPLPKERLAVHEPAFRHIAIDALGPLHIKVDVIEKRRNKIIESGQEERKVWLLVISCMTTRAINIEILHGMMTDAFIHSMRRHFAEFGIAHSVRLDNFRTHQRMSTEFQALLRDTFLTDVRERSQKYGIKWSWSAVGQPSTNGIIERCVRMVKDCLLKTAKRKTLTQQELATFVLEARRIINSRPLAQVSQGDTGAQLSITPNHLIYGHQVEALPFSEATSDQKEQPIDVLWRKRQKLAVEFMQLFQHQYIAGILELKKWRKIEDQVQVGDLCLVQEVNRKRKDWPIGVVEELITNPLDGLIRTVKLRVAKGYVNRSIRSLVFLRHLDEYQGNQDPDEPEPDTHPTTELPAEIGVGKTPLQSKIADAIPEEDEMDVVVQESDFDEVIDNDKVTDKPMNSTLDKPVVDTLDGASKPKRGPGRPRKVATQPSAAPLEEGEGRRLRSGRVIPGPR